MEIEQLRKELNQLLDNIVEHSKDFDNGRPIPSLEISFVLAKITKMQETMIVLRHLLQEQERGNKENQRISKTEKTPIVEEKTIEQNIEEVQPNNIKIEENLSIEMEGGSAENIAKVETVIPPVKDIEKLPIAKLMDALSLNDRYLYANELFNKDMNTFNELVKSIDNSSTFTGAQELLSKYETEYEWDNENEHVISFFSLVERRFLS